MLAALLLAAHLFTSDATTPQVIESHFGNEVEVAATVNGHKLWFNLDTGTSGLVIDRGDAERAGLTIAHGRAYTDIDMGGVQAHNAWFGILNSYENNDQGVHVAGLIGTPFLRSNVITIDFLHKRVIVYPNGSFDPSALKAKPDPIDFDGLVRIHVWFGDKRSTLLLDTGDFWTIIFQPFASSVLVGAPLSNKEPVAIGIGVPQTFIYLSGTVPMSLAGYEFAQSQVWVADHGPPNLPGTLFDGVLGRDVLRAFRMTLDYDHQVVYLEH